MMSTYAGTLDSLGELLGDEHDLTVLTERLVSDSGLRTDSAETGMALALTEHRRRYLQQAALVLGGRVYAESPEAFVSRIGKYWAFRP
jgi:hypothetical protein